MSKTIQAEAIYHKLCDLDDALRVSPGIRMLYLSMLKYTENRNIRIKVNKKRFKKNHYSVEIIYNDLGMGYTITLTPGNSWWEVRY